MQIHAFGDQTFDLYDTEDDIPLQLRKALQVVAGADGAYDGHGLDAPLSPIQARKKFTIKSATWAAQETTLDALRKIAGRGRQLLKFKMRDGTYRHCWAKMELSYPRTPADFQTIEVTATFHIAVPIYEASADRGYLGLHAGTLGNIAAGFPSTLGGNYTQFVLLSSVASIPSIEYWYKADAVAGAYDGMAVDTWEDQSGNAADAAKGTAQNILYRPTAIGGMPGLEFDGTAGDTGYDLAGQTIRTLFVVFYKDAVSSKNGLLIESAGIPESYVKAPDSNSSGGCYAVIDGSYGATTSAVSVGSANPHLIVARRASNAVQIFVDDNDEVEQSMGGSSDEWEFISIGEEWLNSFDGVISEVIGCNAYLDTPFEGWVRNYLANKYSLTIDAVSVLETATITYGGTKRFTGGKLEIRGPVTNPRLTNNTNGYWIQWTGALVVGDRLVIDLTTGRTKKNGVMEDYALTRSANQTVWMALEIGDNEMVLSGTGAYCDASYYWSKWYA